MKKGIIIGSALALTLAVAGGASAQDVNVGVRANANVNVGRPPMGQPAGQPGRPPQGQGMGRDDGRNGNPAVMGVVKAISGTTITLTGQGSTTISVDASKATFMKTGAGASTTSATIANVAVGDRLIVLGSLSNGKVVATKIIDGVGMGNDRGGVMGILGAERPVVVGSVSAVNGNTLTVASRNNTSFTVDATNATAVKWANNATSTIAISSITVGDNVAIVGTVSSTTVTATKIIDGLPIGRNGEPDMHGPTSTPPGNGVHAGFFGKIMDFFARLKFW